MSIRRDEKRAWAVKAELDRAIWASENGKALSFFQRQLLHEYEHQKAEAAAKKRVANEIKARAGKATGRTSRKKAKAAKAAPVAP